MRPQKFCFSCGLIREYHKDGYCATGNDGKACLEFVPIPPAAPGDSDKVREAHQKLRDLGEDICSEHCYEGADHCSWCKQVAALLDLLPAGEAAPQAPADDAEPETWICLGCGKMDAKVISIPALGPDGDADEGCEACGSTDLVETADEAIKKLVSENARLYRFYVDAEAKKLDAPAQPDTSALRELMKTYKRLAQEEAEYGSTGSYGFPISKKLQEVEEKILAALRTVESAPAQATAFESVDKKLVEEIEDIILRRDQYAEDKAAEIIALLRPHATQSSAPAGGDTKGDQLPQQGDL